MVAVINCRWFERHCSVCACRRALLSDGRRMAISSAMMPITTNNSTSVKAAAERVAGWCGMRLFSSMRDYRLHQLELPRNWNLRFGQRPKLQLRGHQADFRLKHVGPADELTAVGAHPAHHRRQHRFGDPLRLVDRLAPGDAGKQVGMPDF